MTRSTYRRLISSIQNISLMIYFNLEAKKWPIAMAPKVIKAGGNNDVMIQ
ncbi:MAG: hypothetical protein J6M65_09255 [Eubacterium sp.]|nr:hypothetical protein [Eubacterium sp.]